MLGPLGSGVSRLRAQAPSSVDPANPRFAYPLRLESALGRTRWCVVLVSLSLILLRSMTANRRFLLPILVLEFVGVTGAWWLHRPSCPWPLGWIRRLGSVLEWAIGLTVVAVFSSEPAAATPGILLVLFLLTAVRHGSIGVLGAGLGAGLTAAALVAAQIWVHEVLTLNRAVVVLGTWLAMLGLGTVLLESLLRASEHGSAQAEQCLTDSPMADQMDSTAHHLHPWHLSDRELELLPLLADDELTYAEIGDRLNPKIAGRTVKSHVENIQQKLLVTGGRRAVVRTARERNLLPQMVSAECPLRVSVGPRKAACAPSQRQSPPSGR